MSYELVDVERAHAEMSAEVLAAYDSWRQVTLGRYAVETLSLEELQREHEEAVLLGRFVVAAVDQLPVPDGGRFITKDKLFAEQLSDSLVRAECYNSGSSKNKLIYVIGLDTSQAYFAKPRSYRSDTTEIYTLNHTQLADGAIQTMKESFKQLVNQSRTKPKLTDTNLREMYDPDLESLTLDSSSSFIPVVTHIAKLFPHRAIQKISGQDMQSAGIFQQLLMLSVRFGVYEQHVTLLEQLSKDLFDVHETTTEERAQVEARIGQMVNIVQQYKQTHPIEVVEPAKSKGLFRRSRSN